MEKLIAEFDSEINFAEWSQGKRAWENPITPVLEQMIYRADKKKGTRYIMRALNCDYTGDTGYLVCGCINDMANRVMDGHHLGSTRLYVSEEGIKFISSGHDVPTGSTIEIAVCTKSEIDKALLSNRIPIWDLFEQYPKLKCKQRYLK